MHADAAAVNVNIWLNAPSDYRNSSSAGDRGPEGGAGSGGSEGGGSAGLLVYKREPPPDWGPEKWNQGAFAGAWLERSNAPRVSVPWASNRCVN